MANLCRTWTILFLLLHVLLVTGCNSQLLDNSIKGTIGSVLGRLSLSASQDNVSLNEGSSTTVVLLLNKPAPKDIYINWSTQDPRTRLSVSTGTLAILKNQTSAQITLQALNNLVLLDNETVSVSFTSADLFNPFHLNLNIIDKTKPALLVATPANYTFPLTATNSSRTQIVVLQNTGDIAASLITNTLAPTTPFDFQGGSGYPGTGGNCGTTLSAGGSCSLVVSFSPTTSSTFNSSFTLSYNDGAQAQTLNYILSGQASSVVATLSGLPASLMSSTSYSITVGGTNITHYQYAFALSPLNCGSATYSSTTPIATAITGSGLTDGSYVLCVVGYDGTLWQQASLATQATWTVDTTPPSLPSLTINGVASGYTASTAASLAPFAVGANQMYITTTSGCGSGGSWESYAVSKAYTLAANSINTVYVKFRDVALNESSCVSAVMTHDNQNPDAPTGLVLGALPVSLTSTPTLSWTAASDNGPAGILKYQARLLKSSDSSQIAAWQDFTSGSQLTGLSLSEGVSYLFEVRSVDKASNISSLVQSSTFVSTSSIAATLSGTPVNPSKTTSLNVAVSGNGVASYKYKVGASASTDCTSATGYSASVGTSTNITNDISALADASIKLCVVGSNGIDWQAYTSATSYSWTKDTSGPTVTLSTSSASPTNVSPIPLTVNFSEPIATDMTSSDLTLTNATLGNLTKVSSMQWPDAIISQSTKIVCIKRIFILLPKWCRQPE